MVVLPADLDRLNQTDCALSLAQSGAVWDKRVPAELVPNGKGRADGVARTRCVPTKTDSQLDLQALHRVRYRLIGNRTAVINQIRGFLLEHGVPVRQGHRFLRQGCHRF